MNAFIYQSPPNILIDLIPSIRDSRCEISFNKKHFLRDDFVLSFVRNDIGMPFQHSITGADRAR